MAIDELVSCEVSNKVANLAQIASSLTDTQPELNAVPIEFQLVDTETLARILNLHPRTLEGWRRKRKLPFIRVGKRYVRFKVRDVFRTLEERYTIKEVRVK
jgi:excisionase family DNA binding protein